MIPKRRQRRSLDGVKNAPTSLEVHGNAGEKPNKPPLSDGYGKEVAVKNLERRKT